MSSKSKVLIFKILSVIVFEHIILTDAMNHNRISIRKLLVDVPETPSHNDEIISESFNLTVNSVTYKPPLTNNYFLLGKLRTQADKIEKWDDFQISSNSLVLKIPKQKTTEEITVATLHIFGNLTKPDHSASTVNVYGKMTEDLDNKIKLLKSTKSFITRHGWNIIVVNNITTNLTELIVEIEKFAENNLNNFNEVNTIETTNNKLFKPFLIVYKRDRVSSIIKT